MLSRDRSEHGHRDISGFLLRLKLLADLEAVHPLHIEVQ